MPELLEGYPVIRKQKPINTAAPMTAPPPMQAPQPEMLDGYPVIRKKPAPETLDGFPVVRKQAPAPQFSPFSLTGSAVPQTPAPAPTDEKPGFFEGIRNPIPAYQQGLAGRTIASDLGDAILEGVLNPIDDPDVLRERKAKIDWNRKLSVEFRKQNEERLKREGPKGLLATGIEGVANQALPGITQAFERGVPMGVAGALGGAALGTTGGPAGALSGTVYGAGQGLYLGAIKEYYKQGVGDNYNDIIDAGVEPKLAESLAVVGAVPYTAMDMLGLNLLATPFKKMLAKGGVEALKKIAKTSPKLIPILARGMKEWGIVTVGESLQEGGQRIITDATSATGLAMQGDKEKAKELVAKIPTNAVDETLNMLPTAGLLPVPGLAIQVPHEIVTRTPERIVDRFIKDEGKKLAENPQEVFDNVEKTFGFKVDRNITDHEINGTKIKGNKITTKEGRNIILTTDAEITAPKTMGDMNNWLRSVMNDDTKTDEQRAMAADALNPDTPSTVEDTFQALWDQGLRHTGTSVAFADSKSGKPAPLSSLIYLANPQDEQNLDHELFHDALVFFVPKREYNTIRQKFTKNGVYDEEAAVRAYLQLSRDQRIIDKYAKPWERALINFGYKLRGFVGSVTGKSFDQITHELRTGQMTQRGVQTDRTEQIRRGASAEKVRYKQVPSEQVAPAPEPAQSPMVTPTTENPTVKESLQVPSESEGVTQEVTREHNEETVNIPDRFDKMTRSELVQEAKGLGVKAVGTNVALRESIRMANALQQSRQHTAQKASDLMQQGMAAQQEREKQDRIQWWNDRIGGKFSTKKDAIREASFKTKYAPEKRFSTEDYRGTHRAPTDGGSLDAMNRTYPDDLYSNEGWRYYGDGNARTDRQAHRLIRSLQGKPDEMVTVYRAVPKGVQSEINPGDWVTPFKEYAASHGNRFEQGQDIISKQVPAGELFTEGNSLYEYGWNPKEGSKFSTEDTKKLSNKAVSDAFYNMASNERNALENVLFNWDDADLEVDDVWKETKIHRYPGRDGRYSKGSEGGKVSGGKRDFLQWLQSDQPFDPKQFDQDEEWVGNINALRKAAGIETDGGRKFSTVYHRGKDPRTTNMTTAQWADDAERISGYGDIQYELDDKHLSDIPDWLNEFVDEYYKETLGEDYDKYLPSSANPEDIVDSAEVWDDADFVSALWDKHYDKLIEMMDSGKYGFRTQNGAVTFQDSRIPVTTGGRKFSTAQTETPQFKRWFGDSKVVDAQGKPLVVYHGDRKNIKIFDIKNDRYRTGLFFTSNPKTAQIWGTKRNGEDYAVYLNIKNPYSVDAKGEGYLNIPVPQEMRNDIHPSMTSIDTDGIAKWAYDNKYDGVIIYNVFEGNGNTEYGTDYVVFSNTQIKSATDNTGAFDPTNPDIRYSTASPDLTRTKYRQNKRGVWEGTLYMDDGRPWGIARGMTREEAEDDARRASASMLSEHADRAAARYNDQVFGPERESLKREGERYKKAGMALQRESIKFNDSLPKWGANDARYQKTAEAKVKKPDNLNDPLKAAKYKYDIASVKAGMARKDFYEWLESTPTQYSSVRSWKEETRREYEDKQDEAWEEYKAELIKAGKWGPGDVKYSTAQTETPQFKRWFGDSKVVDSDGKPLVVYHGTPDARWVENLGTFETPSERASRTGVVNGNEYKEKAVQDRAYFFTESNTVAGSYADDRRAFDYQNAEPGIVQTYLSIKNPLVIDAAGVGWGKRGGYKSQTDTIAEAKKNGYDGLIIRNTRDAYQNTDSTKPHTVYIAFSPTQIKSATGNTGAFDAGNPDIRYSTAEERAAERTMQGDDSQGRPDLANFGEGDARRAVRNVDTEREPQRESVPDDVTFERADKLYSDPVERDRLTKQMESGQGTMNAEEALTAAKIYNDAQNQAFRSGKIDDHVKAAKLAFGFRNVRSNMGAAFRMLRDKYQTPEQRAEQAFGMAFAKGSPQIERQLAVTRNKLDRPGLSDQERKELEKRYDSILRMLALENARIRIKLARKNILIEELLQALREAKTDKQRRKAKDDIHGTITIIGTKKAGWGDRLYELWISSLLWGPTTHVVNLSSNMAHLGWEIGPQRVAEAFFNSFARQPDAAQWGEFYHIGKAIGPGLVRGLSNAWRSFKTESPVFSDELGKNKKIGMAVEHRKPAIPGRRGKAIRFSLRALTAMDEFTKSLAGQMQASAFAYRIGKGDGLTGDKLTEFMQSEIANLGSRSWEEGLKFALRISFQTKMSEKAERMSSIAADSPAKWVVPFRRTPVNILKTGFRKTPLGAISAYRNWDKLNTDDKMRLFSEQFIAAAFTVALGAWLVGGDDDDLPWITGSVGYKSEKTGIRDLAERTVPPQTILIGSRRLNYGRMEPFATTMTTMVDAALELKAALRGKKADEALKDMMSKTGEAATDKTFTRGLADIYEAFTSPEGGNLERYAINFTTSFMPNIVKQVARSTDPVIREQRLDTSSPDKNSQILDLLEYRLIAAPDILPAKRNVWGEEIKKSTTGEPSTDILFRLISPIQNMTPEGRDPFAVKLDRLITNYNNLNPNDTWAPERPKMSFTYNDQEFHMSRDQYDVFCATRGQKALETLQQVDNKGVLNFDKPGTKEITIIKRALERASEFAKRKIILDSRRGIR